MNKAALDQQLVRRAKDGEKAAFELLVLKYQQRIVKLISYFIKNQNDISDVAQEAFIRAYHALPNFREESTFYTWLYRIAVNTAKNYLASQMRRPRENEIDINKVEQTGMSDALKEQATPENLLSSEQLKEVIINTINGLSQDLRTAITLREIEEMSYDEIASVMGCPVGTVRSRIFRARKAIDKKISLLLEN